MPNHPTYYCLTLHDETSELVYGVGNFPGPPQRPYDPYSNTYNSGWQDHPNFSYGHNPWTYPAYQPYQPPKSSLEELVERLEQSQEKFQDRTELDFPELDDQISWLEQAVGRLESQGKIPSQIEANPWENASFITLRNSIPEPEQFPLVVQPPFPSRLIKEHKHAEEKEIMDVEINLPLLEVIRKLPRYACFLKEICTNKRKLSGHENVSLEENVYAVLTRWLPPKFKYQDMFAITRKIHKISLK
ncbi:hypothetical protein GQ457_14G017930 [Hibiscus cannabinus]